jgi:putative inorganic carbon (HCO3(-)) transporter
VEKSRLRNLAQQVASLEFWLLGLVVVASLLWSTLLPLAFALGVIFCFVRWFAFGKPSVRTPADWGVILLFLMAGLSYWITALPEKTSLQVLRLLVGMLLFYTIVNWGSSKSRIGWLVATLVVGGLGLSIIALIGVDWVSEKAQFLPYCIYSLLPVRLSDPAHPNVMAGSLVLFAPMLLALILYKSKPPLGQRLHIGFYVLCFVSLFSVLGVIVLTLSRGALLAFVVAVAVLMAIRWKWGWIIGVTLLSIGIVLARINGPSSVDIILLNDQTVGTMVARLELWSRAIFVVELFPLTGVGMGLFKEVIGYLMPLVAVEGTEIVHAHNLFLQIAVDLGLPGLVAWISILLVVFTISWKLYKSGLANSEGWVLGLGVGLLGSSVALVVHGTLDSVVWGLRSSPIVWAIWGVTIAAGRVYLKINDLAE